MGERVPQHVQNIIIRDYCIRNRMHFLLSATEYAIENSTLILNQLVEELDNIEGIVASRMPPHNLLSLAWDKKTLSLALVIPT